MKHGMKMLVLAGALLLAAPLMAGCTSFASGVATIATNLSSSTPAQVNTYADATLAATLATKTVDLAVNTGKLSKATLIELGALNDGVHSAWLVLKAANAAGKSLDYAAFNAALSAYQSYRTSEGIPEAPATS